MLIQALGGLVVAAGLALTSLGAPDLVAGLASDASCRETTQYDSADGNIRDCNAGHPCDALTPDEEESGVTKECKRRDDRYREDGYTVTVVYCACEPFDWTGTPTGAPCHVYRKHKGARTTPQCTEDSCDDGGYCGYWILPESWPFIYKCKCV